MIGRRPWPAPTSALGGLGAALILAGACQISDTLDPIGRPCGPDEPCGSGSVCDPGSGRCVGVSADVGGTDRGGAPDGPRSDQGPVEGGLDQLAADDQSADLQCAPGMDRCDGECVDLADDPQHCGECFHPCVGGTDRCEDGTCVCGAGGAPCAEGLDCTGGACACVAGGSCSGCCQEGACHSPGAGQDATRCGSGGAACASCDDGLSCTADQCLPAGECESVPVVDGTACDDGVACTHSDQCQHGVCGGVSYSCDAGPACADSACTGNPPPDECALSVDPGFCLIDGTCHADGELNPADPCLQCSVSESTTAWVSESVITPCDPFTSAECVAGAGCYLVQGVYLDCVCDVGTQLLGQPCDTTTDCAPGFACYSSTSSPPGECQLMCDPLAGDCASGQPCQELSNYPTYGTCRD